MEKHKQEGQTLHNADSAAAKRVSGSHLPPCKFPSLVRNAHPTALLLLLDVVPSQNCKYQSKAVEGKVEGTSHLPRDISRMDTHSQFNSEFNSHVLKGPFPFANMNHSAL